MKLYLWGGYDPNKWDIAYKAAKECAKTIFSKEETTEILHIPFARTGIMKKNRGGFLPHNIGPVFESRGYKYFNAMYYEDIEKFSWDTIYINGGNDCEFLLEMCQNEKLFQAVKKTRVIVWESCWAMIMWEYFRNNENNGLLKGLGFIKDTIVEPHFTEKSKEERLALEMKKTWTKLWLWIDENTFIAYNDWVYWEKVWLGWVYHR